MKQALLHTRHKGKINVIEYGVMFLMRSYPLGSYRLPSTSGDGSKIYPKFKNKQAISKTMLDAS